MKQNTWNGMKRLSVNIDQMQAFVIINNVRMMINAGANAQNQLIKMYVIKNLFGILVIVSVSECEKSCDVSEYLDNENCTCRNKLIDKFVAECTENTDEVKIAEITLAWHENVCICSYIICVILAVMALTISIEIFAYLAYKYINHWYLEKDVIRVKFGTCTQTTI